MFKTFTSYTHCKNSLWGGKRVGRQRTQYDYLCPDGPSTTDIPNKDENIKEPGITAPGSVRSVRPLGTFHLTKRLLLLKRRRKILKPSFFWTREQRHRTQMSRYRASKLGNRNQVWNLGVLSTKTYVFFLLGLTSLDWESLPSSYQI